jgi:hypothetical protein
LGRRAIRLTLKGGFAEVFRTKETEIAKGRKTTEAGFGHWQDFQREKK